MADYLPALDVDTLLDWFLSPKAFQAEQARLFSFDLAHMPFRFIGLPSEMVAQHGIPARKTAAHCANAAELLPDNVVHGIRILAKLTRFKHLPHGLLFASRPYNLPELFILNKAAYEASEHAAMKAVVLAVRGFDLGEAAPSFDKHGVLQIPDGQPQHRYAKALLVATPASLLVDGKKPRKLNGVTQDQMAKMEREMTNLQGQYKLVEQTYGQDILNLVLAKGYLARLLENEAVSTFLRQRHSDLLSEFELIIQTVSLDQ